jgi:iron complex outermembrane receptor protein
MLPIVVFSQGALSGTVKGNGSPLGSVSVVVNNTGKGTTTDNEGKYSISLPAASYKVSFSILGFVTKSIDVTLAEGEQKILDIELEQVNTSLEELIIVGTRALPRSSANTPLPIDILSSSDIKSTGQSSFDKALQYRVPSFNTVQTPVNDATSLLDPYEIRNMGPSRTLILINGKRKNASSLIYIQTSPARGEGGADIAAIPSDAIKRVEILRDGASAQYGSDAIAGVMNIILKDKGEYGSFNINSSITHKGDGEMLELSLNNGSNIGRNGFLNYTVSMQQIGLANRPGIVDAQGEANDFGADINTVKAFLAIKPDAGNINGSPKTTNAKFLVNGAVPYSEFGEVYFNAAYLYKKVNSYANYRTPYWRPTDFGLLTPAGQTYLGYVPTFEGDLNDYNGTMGFRSTKNGWKNDVSLTVGGNKQLYTVENTVNRSLGKNSPISFKPGGYSFNHAVGNIDISKSVTDKFAVGAGAEFRTENFEIIAGDTASYVGSGADSFPGIGENNASKSTRYNFGGYVDASYDFSKKFLINATARLEDYSDFGDAFVWKISSRYRFSDIATIRSSYSTGFRAPSLHQINLQIAQASFVPGQGIQTKGIVNNRSSQARLLGVPALDPEKSTNFTVGLGFNPTNRFSLTLDYYSIQLKDRIILSSEISKGGTPQSATLDKVLDDNGIVAVSFFTNGMNTSTQGIDLVAGYRDLEFGTGKLMFTLAGNYTLENKVTAVHNPPLIASAGKSVLDFVQEALLLSSRPEYKAILGIGYKMGKADFSLNNTLFGPTTFRQNGLNANLKTEFSTNIVTDIGAGFQFSDRLRFAVNVNNVFNRLPEWEFKALNSQGEAILKDAAQVKANSNAITFNQRYSIVTYDGSQFSMLGTIFAASLSLRL